MLVRLRDIQIPILTKIALPYFILALIVAVGGIYLVTRVLIDSLEERFTNQLIETGLLASENVVREEEDLLENLRFVSHIQGIAQAVEYNEIDLINLLVLPAAFNANVEALAILISFGRELQVMQFDVAQQSYRPLVPTERIAMANFVENVLRGEEDEFGDKFSGLIHTTEGGFVFVAGPILDSRGRLVGVALIGKSQEALAQQLREKTLGQLSFYALDGSLQASTLAEGNPISEAQVESILAG